MLLEDTLIGPKNKEFSLALFLATNSAALYTYNPSLWKLSAASQPYCGIEGCAWISLLNVDSRSLPVEKRFALMEI